MTRLYVCVRALVLLFALSELPSVVKAQERASCTAQFEGRSVPYPNCHSEGDNFRVLWAVNGDMVDTMFIGKGEGWAGMAWGASRMVPADAVIAYRAPNGSYVVEDFSMTGYSSADVTVSTKQGITAREVEFRNGEIAARFRRPLSGADIATLPSEGEAPFVWALGPDSPSAPRLSKHTNAGVASVNLATGAGSTTRDDRRAIFIAHAVLMSVAWLLMSPVAVIAMRFFKKMNPVAFQVHRGLNAGSVLLTLISTIMALVRGSHRNTPHLVIGVLVTIFGLLEVVNGNLRPGKEANLRKAWFRGHAWLGRTTLVLAWVNIFLGLLLVRAVAAWWIVVGVVMGAFVLVSGGLSLFPTKFPIFEEKAVVAEEGDRNP